MIPRSSGPSAKVEPRNIVGGLFGVLVLIVINETLPSQVHLLVDSWIWRVANAALLALACVSVGAALGLLPAWLSRPAVITIAALSVILYFAVLPFHESDGYLGAIHVLIVVPSVLLGARLGEKFRARLVGSWRAASPDAP